MSEVERGTRRRASVRAWASGIVALVLVSGAWTAITLVAARDIWAVRAPSAPTEVAVGVVLAAVIGFVVLGGVRALSMAIAYPVLRRVEQRQGTRTGATTRTADDAVPTRVAILLCTADDFAPDRLARTMQQTHPHVQTFVLDDSSDPEVRAQVDRFAAESGAEVVRRVDRHGFKAGNLNHFLSLGIRHDAYVVVDADQVLRPDFVERALARLTTPEVGVVQGRQLVHDDTSAFARRFGGLLRTHIAVTQASRSRFGFSMFMGRGALITAACVRVVGRFPEVVMEDLAFSVEARRAGQRIVWAPEALSSEDYPIDYAAFRKQQSKFAQGSVEFLRRYVGRVLVSPLRVREKTDLLLDCLATPVSSGLAIALFLVNLLPTGPYGWGFLPQQEGIALGVCGAAPLLPEAVRTLRRRGVVPAVAFFVQASALYTSTLWLTLSSMVRVAAGGRAHFVVTPKRRGTTSIASLLREAAVAVAAVVLAFLVAHGPGAAMVFVVMTLAAAWMHVLDRPRGRLAEQDVRRRPRDHARQRQRRR